MKTKLTIFKIAATNLSFTKTAEQLFISQPAISKAIKSLEDEFKTTLFVRKRNSLELTEQGKSFLLYVNRILAIYNEMENQFLYKQDHFPDNLHFGVSTTIGNYIIPNVIAKFRIQFPEVKFHVTSDNSENIEKMILNEEINFGIIEGRNTNRKFDFRKFIKDEIVLVTNVNNQNFWKGVIDLKDLQKIPLVSREIGSGTKEIIDEFLAKHSVKSLNTIVTLNSTEAIKNFLINSDSYAFLSINAVGNDLLNNRLRIIDIEGLSIERWFYFISRTGYQSKVMDYIEKFSHSNYNF